MYTILSCCILTGKARHTVNSFWFQFMSKTFNLLVKHGKVIKTRWDGHKKFRSLHT